MYEKTTDTDQLQWQPLDFKGVTMKVMHQDETTGEMTVMTRIEAGAEIPRHKHTKAAETVFVLEGDFIEDGHSFQKGSFLSDPANKFHGPHRSKGGCTVLTTFSDELDFVLDESE
ncbi:MAG: cupin domain-containing protein [Planctomycetota bacterium]